MVEPGRNEIREVHSDVRRRKIEHAESRRVVGDDCDVPRARLQTDKL
jgi:hypothetical protein